MLGTEYKEYKCLGRNIRNIIQRYTYAIIARECMGCGRYMGLGRGVVGVVGDGVVSCND